MNLTGLTDQELADMYEAAEINLQKAQKAHGHIQQEIFRRLELRGSRAIQGTGQVYEAVYRYEYDQGKLGSVIELLTPDQKSEAWIPETTKIVPGRYDIRKLQSVCREYHGKEALELIEAARVEKGRSLKAKE